MIFYISLIVLLFNIIIFRNNKKYFIICSFSLLFLIAALRKYTVGIDLAGHYASNFLKFNLYSWSDILSFRQNNTTFYDFGLIFFMKLISLINNNVQTFIIITSAIIYGLIGRYIYKHSKNPYMETIIFYTTFSYFMYMNIIAQGIAVAIILFSIDFLERKKYLKFIICVLLAAFIHSSAIICLLFIPLRIIKDTKKNIRLFIIIAVIFVFSVNTIIPLVIKYVLPQFEFYLSGAGYASINKAQLSHLILYGFCLIIGLMFGKKAYNNEFNETNINKTTQQKITNTNFLYYMTILSIVFRFLALKVYIFSRAGFYFYPFAYTLLSKSVSEIKNKETKKLVTYLVYVFVLAFFVLLNKTLDKSYGVLPYKFFWQ